MDSSSPSFIHAQRLLLSSPPYNSGSNQPILNPNTLSVIFLLVFIAFFLIIFISFHLNRLCTLLNKPYPFPTGRGEVVTIPYYPSYNSPPPPQGLECKLLESLPKVIFRSSSNHEEKKKQKQKQEESCAICLDEYRDKENLLLLPSCAHIFHPQCIKAWLNTHTNCPLCRQSLIPSELTELVPSVEPLNLHGEQCQIEIRGHSMDNPQLQMSRGRDTHHSSPLCLHSNTIWGISDTPSSVSSSDATYPDTTEILGSSFSAKYLKRSNSDIFVSRKDGEGSSILIEKRALTRFASVKYGSS